MTTSANNSEKQVKKNPEPKESFDLINAVPKDITVVGKVGENNTRTVTVDGVTLDSAASFKLLRKSFAGFSWGYSGGGPYQLAFAILCQSLPAEWASVYMNKLVEAVISKLPRTDFNVKISLRLLFNDLTTKGGIDPEKDYFLEL